VWDLDTGQPVWEQKARADWSADVAYSPDGRWLASTGVDDRAIGATDRTGWRHSGVAILWDAETGREIRKFENPTAGGDGVAFSPESRWLASGWGDGIVRIWDTKDPASEAREFSGHDGGVNRVVFLPDGRLVSAGGRAEIGRASGFGEVTIWDLATGRVL